MSGKLNRITIIMVTILPCPVCSQIPYVTPEIAEELLYREEPQAIPAEVMESTVELSSIPVDLNSASADLLEASGLFTDYQIRELIKYRDMYGLLFSVHELAVVPGFHPSLIRKIGPRIQVLPGTPHPLPGTRRRWWLLMEAGGEIGEKDPAYAGAPLKTCLRIRTEKKKGLSLAATCQKDAGELFFREGKPEFLSGYVSFNGNSICRQLVAGTFKIHHGAGLVNGTGFMHSPGLFLDNPSGPSRLQPYRSVTESSYERGMAGRFAAGGTELTCWISCRSLDLSAAHLSKEPDWMEHARENGYHRTESEIGGGDLLQRFHTGLQCIMRLKRFTVGVLAGWERTGLTPSGIDSLQGLVPHAGYIHHHPTLSLYKHWRGAGCSFFSELAFCRDGGAALLAGAGIRFTDFLRGQLLIHRYGNHFRGAYPASYPAGNQIAGQRGIALHVVAEPGNRLEAAFTIELFDYTGPRHQVLLPVSDYRFCFSIGNPATSDTGWNIRWKRKVSPSMPAVPGGTGIRSISVTGIDRVEWRCHFRIMEFLQCRYRLTGTFLHREELSKSGLAASLETGLRAGKQIRFKIQAVTYRVDNWENRIYLYQPGLYYSFHFPVCYGTGHRTTLILVWKPWRRLIISAALTGNMQKETDRNSIRADFQLRFGL